MASRIEFAVSMTPIKSIPQSGDSPEVDVIANDINKTLGATGSVNTGDGQGDHTTGGYNAGAPSDYADAGTGAQINAAAQDFIYIRHTGKQYDNQNSSISNEDSSTNVFVRTVSTNGTIISEIASGEAIILPRCPSNMFVTSSSSVAVEYAIID